MKAFIKSNLYCLEEKTLIKANQELTKAEIDLVKKYKKEVHSTEKKEAKKAD